MNLCSKHTDRQTDTRADKGWLYNLRFQQINAGADADNDVVMAFQTAETSLHIAARVTDGVKCAEILIKSGADCNASQQVRGQVYRPTAEVAWAWSEACHFCDWQAHCRCRKISKEIVLRCTKSTVLFFVNAKNLFFRQCDNKQKKSTNSQPSGMEYMLSQCKWQWGSWCTYIILSLKPLCEYGGEG